MTFRSAVRCAIGVMLAVFCVACSSGGDSGLKRSEANPDLGKIACELTESSDVSQAFGGQASEGKPLGPECVFEVNGGLANQVAIYVPKAAETVDDARELFDQQRKVNEVTGSAEIGDEAFTADGGIVVRDEKVVFAIYCTSVEGAAKDALIELAESIAG